MLASDDLTVEDVAVELQEFDPRSKNGKLTEKVKDSMSHPTPADPWEMPELKDDSIPWNELDTNRKCIRVAISCMKFFLLIGFLYLFICSLSFLGNAFQLLGGKAAGTAFRENDTLKNPIAGLMIGVLATVLMQSSSTSTSIIVSMVAAEILDVAPAIYIIMGANIGTSVTNTIVAMGQSRDRDEFRRSFAGATVHDMFNWLSVLVFLPLEVASSYLFRLTKVIVNSIHLQDNVEKQDFLKKITKPFTKRIIQINKSVINKIAQCKSDEECVFSETSMIKQCFREVTDNDAQNGTGTGLIETKCNFVFSKTGLSDTAVGVIMLILALILLCTCLLVLVKLLKSILKGSTATVIKKTINTDLDYPFGWVMGYVAIIVGAALTFILQSSSVFTSALTPLVGVGVVSIHRMYPLTLGSNIGTTGTAILAALASEHMKEALQVAFAHLFFNISGIILWYPIPFMRVIPIKLACGLGNITANYRWFSVFYLVLAFFLLPFIVFSLSLAGWQTLVGVGVPVVLCILFILFVNLLQKKKPTVLPSKLRTWDWLPMYLRSLEPADRVISKGLNSYRSMTYCKSKRMDVEMEQNEDQKPFYEAKLRKSIV